MVATPPSAVLRRLGVLALALLPLAAPAQYRYRSYSDVTEGGEHRWETAPAFKEDVFTFARLIYNGSWDTDVPDAEYFLTLRLQQLTSLKVRPGLNFKEITPRNLARFPFVYMVEPGRMQLANREIEALRNYLLKGGFLMVDDFWGDYEWANFYNQIKRVFPDLPVKELSLSHPIFHTVFDMQVKPQMPGVQNFLESGLTYEYRNYGRVSHDSHYYGIFDAKGRMMVFIGLNNDFGDGWEREGVNPTYFHRFSEKQAYPMMINIVFYAMTH